MPIIEAAAQGIATLSPEAMIIATNAANSASDMAKLAAMGVLICIFMILILGVITIVVAVNFWQLKYHTNSIMEALLKLTGDEALAKGIAQGRQAFKAEQEHKSGQPSARRSKVD